MYLDGGDVKWCSDAENGHDDGLVLLVDEDFHVSDVLFSWHLRDVFVGHIGLSGPERKQEKRTQLTSRNLITCVSLRLRHLQSSLAIFNKHLTTCRNTYKFQ